MGRFGSEDYVGYLERRVRRLAKQNDRLKRKLNKRRGELKGKS